LFRPLGAEVSTRRYGTFGLSDERHYATFILGRRASTTSHAYAASFFSQRFCSSADALSLLEYGNFCLERIHAPIKAEIGRVHFFCGCMDRLSSRQRMRPRQNEFSSKAAEPSCVDMLITTRIFVNLVIAR
jgi:hypothetical protein